MVRRDLILTRKNISILTSGPLGGLERINFVPLGFFCRLNMSGHITITPSPLNSRVREIHAVCAGGEFAGSITAHAFVHDGVASASVEAASFFSHENAFNIFFRC